MTPAALVHPNRVQYVGIDQQTLLGSAPTTYQNAAGDNLIAFAGNIWDTGSLSWIKQTAGGGGGGGAATIADGADVTEGAIADVKVVGDVAGSVSAKLRGINTGIQSTIGLGIPVFDYTALAQASTTDTWTFKTGGSGGTLVATITITYTDSGKGTILNVAKT